LVEQIGQGSVEVTSLLGSGDSPATFQPTDFQITAVLRSRLFFRIGVPFENGRWMEAIRSTRRVPIVDTRRGIDLRPMPSAPRRQGGGLIGSDLNTAHDGARAGLDPHIWLSPRLLEIQARTIADAMRALDPDSANRLRMNLTQLISELDRLDRRLSTKLAPYRGQTFMVFHPSWGYFANDYGLRQVAIEIEGKEPTDDELTEIQRLARELNTGIIFVQPQIHSRAAEAIAEAIGAKVVVIDPLQPDIISNLQQVADLLVAGFAEAATP
jgi:zinc transport system substrate-binding protein